MHPKFLLTGLLLSLLGLTATAQTQIRGSVYDRLGRNPLPEVVVTLEGTSVRVLTDRDGFFVLPPVDSGAHRLTFARAGYRTQRRTLDILKKDPVFSVGIALSPLGVGSEEPRPALAHGYPRQQLLSPFVQDLPNSRQWRQWQSRSLPEALAGLPGLWLLSPDYATPTLQLRGLDPRRQGWRYEGLPLSPSLNLPGQAPVMGLLDPWAIDQVQVLRGHGLITQSAGAAAGQVSLRQQAPTYAWRKLAVHGQARHQELGQQVGRVSRLALSAHTPWAALSVGGSRRRWGDLQGGDTLALSQSGYAQDQRDLTLALKLGRRQDLTLGYRSGQQREARLQGQFRTRPDQPQDQRDHQLAFARYRLFLDNPLVSQIKVTTGWQRYRSQLTRQAVDSLPGLDESLSLATWSLRGEVVSAPSALWHIYSGFELIDERVSSDMQPAAALPDGVALRPTLLPDGSRSGQGSLFTLHTLDLLKLRLTFGGRAQADLAQGEGPTGPAFDWRTVRLSGNVGGMYPLSQKYQLFSNLRAGYRSPGLFELGGFGPIAAGIAVPNDSLVGERVITSEIGLKAETEHFSGTLALYRSRFTDFIGYAPATWQGEEFFQEQAVWRPQNQGRAFIQGVEASVEVPIVAAVALYGSFTYAYGERVNQGLPMDRVPPLNSRLGVFWQHPWGFWSRLEWRHAGQQELLTPLDRRDPAVGTGVAAWDVVDWQVGYEFRWGYATLGVLNLLDENYRYFGSDIPGQGRVLVGSLQLGF